MCKPKGRSWKGNKRPGNLVFICAWSFRQRCWYTSSRHHQFWHLRCFTCRWMLQLGQVSIPYVYTDHWCCHASSALCEETCCWCMACMTKCHPLDNPLLVSEDVTSVKKCPVSSLIWVLIKCATLMETYLIVAILHLDYWTPRLIM
jgi:hypothetical protein